MNGMVYLGSKSKKSMPFGNLTGMDRTTIRVIVRFNRLLAMVASLQLLTFHQHLPFKCLMRQALEHRCQQVVAQQEMPSVLVLD